ncbi:MAG: aminopeptidase [Rudaea sp.]
MILSLLASACTNLRYLAHVSHGEMQIAHARQPLDKVIAAPTTDPELARRLALARAARRFASQRLGLPDNRSYTSYVDLHRPYVVWNVFAASRYSVDPVLHCFPIAGCVPYRGYFEEAKANAEAARLHADGDDVFVGGVAAYSTLGWFADPILSSMLRWDDDELAGTIFHELAHQLIYVKDDTAFNESFATFVQREGLREWRVARGLAPSAKQRQHNDDEFIKLVLDLRERLRQLYAGGGDKTAMGAGKQALFADFRARYRQWRDAHSPYDRAHDAFVAAPLNNASLLPFGLYDQWVPAFAALFTQSDSQWPEFYARARALAKFTPTQRNAELRALK